MTQSAGRKEWIGLAVIALPCVVYAMDLTVLNLALPAIGRDLHPSSAQLLWIADVYGFLVAGSLITMGSLGDRIGRRRLLLIGAGAFALASLLAAFAQTAAMLIVARALLGLAGGTLAPSTLSLIRVMFPDQGQRTVAIGIWITSYSAGAAIGPLAGGALLELSWWGSVFLLGVPVMALLLVLGPRLLPEFRDPDAGRLDLRSAALSVASVLAVIYALKQVAQGGAGAQPVLAFAAGLALGIAFVRRQLRLDDPLIDLGLLRLPAFSGALAANLLGFFATFGVSLLVAQYLQTALGLSPLAAGLWSLPEALGFIASSMLTPRLVRHVRAPAVVAGGLLVGASGLATIATVDGNLAPIVAGSLIMSLGLGPVVTLATDLTVGAAPVERAGAASAISETSSELGGALGIAILGSIATAVYRANAPSGARDMLGASGAGLTQGLQIAAVASAVVLAAAAIIAGTLLRRGARPAAAPCLAEA